MQLLIIPASALCEWNAANDTNINFCDLTDEQFKHLADKNGWTFESIDDLVGEIPYVSSHYARVVRNPKADYEEEKRRYETYLRDVIARMIRSLSPESLSVDVSALIDGVVLDPVTKYSTPQDEAMEFSLQRFSVVKDDPEVERKEYLSVEGVNNDFGATHTFYEWGLDVDDLENVLTLMDFICNGIRRGEFVKDGDRVIKHSETIASLEPIVIPSVRSEGEQSDKEKAL